MNLSPARVASRYLSLTPEGRVVLEDAKLIFFAVDEWHPTHLEVTLASPERLSDQDVKSWLQAHWHDVVSRVPWKPPAPAPEYASNGSYGGWDDEDDDEEDVDTSEQPEPGLGWMNPLHETLRTAEAVKVRHPRAGVIQVDIGWSHR